MPSQGLRSSAVSGSRFSPQSKFTFKHLSLLGGASTASPLRVIAHIDLDAFYAQCEMVRLKVPNDQPLAVQQWDSLIAVNYPAREFGLSRMINPSEAKEKCPSLICQHVATWKEGEDTWAYREDAAANIATQKACLDPYRLESRKILACIKNALPLIPQQRVEKAGIDEVFLDLSAQVYLILRARYPQLTGHHDPSERLPPPPTTALDWDADALVDLDNAEARCGNPDWDDVAILIGSEIVRGVRRAIRELLQYTCSAGLARNKFLAKLGSGYKKPNQQTVIRNRAVREFLRPFKFTKIRNLGGKLGDQVVAAFDTDSVEQLLDVTFGELKQKLPEETATWLYQTIRGEDYSEVVSRTQIKSMLSAKSFRPAINSFEQGERWLRVFVADIFARLVEEGVLENKRRPKTITLHHRQGGTTSSRQLPIPRGKAIDSNSLLELAKQLLRQIIAEGNTFPCSNLSLSVGGLEDGPSGYQDIGTFFVRGAEAKSMTKSRQTDDKLSVEPVPPLEKRRKTAEGSIERFFKHEPSRDESEDVGSHIEVREENKCGGIEPVKDEDDLFLSDDDDDAQPTKRPSLDQHICVVCASIVPTAEKISHADWHLAMELQAAEGGTPVEAQSPDSVEAERPRVQRPKPGSSKPKPKPGRLEKLMNGRGGASSRPGRGQMKLAFGR